jgi:hypothetical protein
MGFYTENFLNKRRKWWFKSIYKVEVMVGSTWYTGTLQKKELENDKIVIHAVFPELTAFACTITSLRVIDCDGEVAVLKSESITTLAQQSVLIKIELPIKEQEV